jgi:N-acetylglutamate synthase-like GNAT family acetyltransferase
MTIRRATSEEAATLTQIALDAKRYWGYPEHWIKHWEADLAVSPEFIHDNEVYVAEDAGEIVGFYALIVNERKAELEHMWVVPRCIGTGVGKELFLDAMERAAALDVRDVELSADPNAAGFYRRMGAVQIGEVDAPVEGQHDRKLPRLKAQTKL